MKPCEVCGLRECNHRVPKDLQEEIGEGCDEALLDEAQAAADEYYARSKKTVFVPVEVEYHEPTDTIFEVSWGAKISIERAMRDNPARKIIEAEINLYEDEIEGWKNDDTIVDRINRQMEIDKLKAAIKALKLLANKF